MEYKTCITLIIFQTLFFCSYATNKNILNCLIHYLYFLLIMFLYIISNDQYYGIIVNSDRKNVPTRCVSDLYPYVYQN